MAIWRAFMTIDSQVMSLREAPFRLNTNVTVVQDALILSKSMYKLDGLT